MSESEFTKSDYVVELYHRFHESLLEDEVKDFDEIQTIYQRVNMQLLSKHKAKKLFLSTPRKSEYYVIYENLVARKLLPCNYIFETILTSKLVRSSSGVLPISIALDGRVGSCTYDCSMCPNECKSNGAEQDIARSYLSSEGTFIRGKIQDFSVVEQTWRRLAELEVMGHPPDKLEFILLGGTFDCYPKEYRYQTSIDIFYACNTYRTVSIKFNGEHRDVLQNWFSTRPFVNNSPLSKDLLGVLYDSRPRPIVDIKNMKQTEKLLIAEQLVNTKCRSCRAIGIVHETRPDRVNRYSLTELRKLGSTRIQIGIQTDNDDVLAYNNRGHTVATSIKANREIRDNGFKIDGHIMPDLPGTTLEIDYKMVQNVFLGSNLQLDYCKLYPCLDLPFTKIRELKKTGEWVSIAETRYPEFLDFLAYTMSIVPPWTRVNRVQRDFPEASEANKQLGYVSDTIRTNLQQIVTQHMEKKGLTCHDVRSREVRNAIIDTQLQYAKLYIRVYRANEGTEFFLSVEIPDGNGFDDTRLLGLCRLRIPDFEFTEKENIPFHYLPVYRNKTGRIARIRELHVYGNIASLTQDGNSQHRGIGTFLMSTAETITRMLGCTMISVISGVGVRDYYENLGYSLDKNEDQYMVKRIERIENNMSLRLFDKMYNTDRIHKSIRSSIIVQKYILKNADPNQAHNSRDTHVYDRIQNGEAQGFAFEGEGKNEYEGEGDGVGEYMNAASMASIAKGLYFSISFLYVLYVFYFSQKSLDIHTK
jgi:ELP3 family radical SAM enzyme/protein acetyltransferase